MLGLSDDDPAAAALAETFHNVSPAALKTRDGRKEAVVWSDFDDAFVIMDHGWGRGGLPSLLLRIAAIKLAQSETFTRVHEGAILDALRRSFKKGLPSE